MRAFAEAREIEQVADQPVHALGFVQQRIEQCALALAAERRFAVAQRRSRADDRRERRAEIMRDRAEQHVAQALRFDLEPRVLRGLRELDALHRDRRLIDQRFDQAHLLRDLQLARIGRAKAEHADAALERVEREIDRRCAGERVGVEPGLLAMIVRPLRDAEVIAGHRVAVRARRGAR